MARLHSNRFVEHAYWLIWRMLPVLRNCCSLTINRNWRVVNKVYLSQMSSTGRSRARSGKQRGVGWQSAREFSAVTLLSSGSPERNGEGCSCARRESASYGNDAPGAQDVHDRHLLLRTWCGYSDKLRQIKPSEKNQNQIKRNICNHAALLK